MFPVIGAPFWIFRRRRRETDFVGLALLAACLLGEQFSKTPDSRKEYARLSKEVEKTLKGEFPRT
jgi:hypothetical protein